MTKATPATSEAVKNIRFVPEPVRRAYLDGFRFEFRDRGNHALNGAPVLDVTIRHADAMRVPTNDLLAVSQKSLQTGARILADILEADGEATVVRVVSESLA